MHFSQNHILANRLRWNSPPTSHLRNGGVPAPARQRQPFLQAKPQFPRAVHIGIPVLSLPPLSQPALINRVVIGNLQFQFLMSAAPISPMLSKGPLQSRIILRCPKWRSPAEVDGRVVYAGEIIAWLNHLFGETYTNVRSKDLRKIYKPLPENSRKYDLFKIVIPGQGISRSTFEQINYLCIANLELFDKLVAEEETTESAETGFSTTDAIQTLRCALKIIA